MLLGKSLRAREPTTPAGAVVLSLQMSWESAVWFQCEDSCLGQPEARVPPLLPEAYHVVSVSQTASAFLECFVSRVPLSTQLGRGGEDERQIPPEFLALTILWSPKPAMSLFPHLDREMQPLA